jgi:hypothetical protein
MRPEPHPAAESHIPATPELSKLGLLPQFLNADAFGAILQTCIYLPVDPSTGGNNAESWPP